MNVKMSYWDRTDWDRGSQVILSKVSEDSMTIPRDKDIPDWGNTRTGRKNAEPALAWETEGWDINAACLHSQQAFPLPPAVLIYFLALPSPLLSPTCHSIPFPLLHLLTSCPKHMGMRNKQGDHVAVSKGMGCSEGWQVRWRAEQGQALGAADPTIALLHLETFLAVSWPTFHFAWFWLIAAWVLIQRKCIKQIVKFHKEKMKTKASQLIYEGKRTCWGERILNRHPIKIWIHGLSACNHHQVMLISKHSAQVLPSKSKK